MLILSFIRDVRNLKVSRALLVKFLFDNNILTERSLAFQRPSLGLTEPQFLQLTV